jgi:hypothetical protein
MSSEHATEQVPLAEIEEGDMLQDPMSGNWIKVTHTADGTMSVTHYKRHQDRICWGETSIERFPPDQVGDEPLPALQERAEELRRTC